MESRRVPFSISTLSGPQARGQGRSDRVQMSGRAGLSWDSDGHDCLEGRGSKLVEESSISLGGA